MASNLKTPPTLAPDTLRVIPLGGLGDVGRNMASFELNGERLLVDCGVLFPEENHPGVDLILPGLDAITDQLDQVQALVLTMVTKTTSAPCPTCCAAAPTFRCSAPG